MNALLRNALCIATTCAGVALTLLTPASVRAEAPGPIAPSPFGVIAIPPPSPNAEKPSPDPKSFAGMYVGAPLDMSAADPFGPPKDIHYTPKAEKRFKRRIELRQKNMEEASPGFYCRPYAAITNVSQPVFPTKVVQTNKRLVFLTEEGRTVWEIFLDRDHPKEIVPTYDGHSVGHWEGDTLVVDMVGFNGKAWLDLLAGPNSTQVHIKAWIKKIDNGNKLEIKYELSDPDIYVEPFVGKSVLQWNPEVRLAEFSCEDSIGIGTFPGNIPGKYDE